MGYQINGTTKTILLTAGTVSVSVRDMWSRFIDWHSQGDNSKYLLAFRQVGGDDIDTAAGTKIPIYLYLVNGWRIRPQESDHTLNVGDGILLVDGGGDPFLNTLGDYTVRVNYQQPVQAISFSSEGGAGGGGLTTDQELKLNEIWKYLNLDRNDPMIFRKDRIRSESEDIDISITGDSVENIFTRE